MNANTTDVLSTKCLGRGQPFEINFEILKEILKMSSTIFNPIYFESTYELDGMSGQLHGYDRYKIMSNEKYLGDITFLNDGGVKITSIVVSKWSLCDLDTNLADPNSFKLISKNIKLLVKNSRTSFLAWSLFLIGFVVGSIATLILFALLIAIS